MADSGDRLGQILAITAVVVTGLAAGCGGDAANRDATVEVDTIGGVVVVRNGTGLWGESERWQVVEEFRVGGSQCENRWGGATGGSHRLEPVPNPPSRRDVWFGSDPRHQGRACECTLASMPYRAFGEGGRSRHGLSGPSGNAQADARKAQCESPKGWTVNRPSASFSHSGAATGGSARTSANALRSVSPPDRGSGPWRRRPSTSTPSSRIGSRRSWTPPLPRKRRVGPGQDHLKDCTHGPRVHRQPFSRRDRASTPFLWLDHPPRGCRVPRPEARNRGYSYPSGGRVRALQAILRPRIPPNGPPNAQNARESGFPGSTGGGSLDV